MFDDVVGGLVCLRGEGIDALQDQVARCAELLDVSQTSSFSASAAAQWLALRLQAIGVVVLGTVCGFAIMEHLVRTRNHHSEGDTSSGPSSAAAGLAGLALSYTLPIVNTLEGLIGSFAETEKEMVSMERLQEYSDVPVELTDPQTRSPADVGMEALDCAVGAAVRFDNLTVRYDGSSKCALHGVSLDISAGSKVSPLYW